MATATGSDANGIPIQQPKPRNPNPQALRAYHEDATLAPSPTPSSDPGTPGPGTPTNAPPSVKATSSARKQVRAEQKRGFPRIQYAARVSHFDPRSEYANFRGFFVLFWIALTIMVLTTALRNLKETGYPLSMRQWGLFTKNIYEMAVIDLVMVASTGISLPLNLMFKNSKGWLQWERQGMAVQSIFQAFWLLLWVSWPFLRDWTWTAQVFFTLHLLVMFMKMHSYAFYNGHLANTLHRLSALDDPAANTSTAAAVKYPSSQTPIADIGDKLEEEETAEADSVTQLRDDLAMELVSPFGRLTYPQNLTAANYVDFLLCPTLCYELEYPRTSSRSYLEIFWKTLAVVGCIFLLTITSEEFIIPVLDESAERLEYQHNWQEGSLVFAETVSRLLFPFMVAFLLVFLVIFEYLLGAFAEITCFADRQFYSDWWNSLDWLEFSREWNVPVHHFFRRHVYSASRNTMSRPVATFITFLVSSIAHELVMGCITRKFRGYGFVAMMLQMPIVLVQRSPWIRNRTILNNVLFWCSMILGLSMMCALYVLL
ncbi:sterol O-acyltransferase [Aureobasidium pullulans]|uniref:O-acyltransferase n=1 Tax=Aureobasidium pullulans TaxID=5580 RepID=A0A4V4L1A0_AURPU|nr:sterol O-acyltransferase [Aureobasidium pullulans]